MYKEEEKKKTETPVPLAVALHCLTNYSLPGPWHQSLDTCATHLPG